MTNIILAFCAGAMLIVVLCAVGAFFDELRKLRRLSEWNDKKAVERWCRQKQWSYSADGCSILVELVATVYGPVPDVYLHAAAAWATKTVLDAAALRENTGKDEAGKPHEVVGDSGLLATEDKAVFRVANPSEQ